MTSELSALTASTNIPQLGRRAGAVAGAAAGGKSATIRAEGNGVHESGRTSELSALTASTNVPQPDGAVVAAAGEELAVWAEGQCRDRCSVTGQDSDRA